MEQLVNSIIRPPRAEYDPKRDLFEHEFILKGRWYQRKDVEIKNSRGDVLQCSHYMPLKLPEGKPLPCVIYCHGNSGCRADASEAAIVLLPSNITLFTLDFSGSGLSGGEHVTLGWNEKDDLKAAVDYLRKDGDVSLISLWGRSMGAVTSLMYGAEDPSIAGMVLDSPFSNLVDLMTELVDTYKIRLPKFTVKFAIQYMRRAVQKKANFDIMDLNAIKVAKSCFVPVLFGHAIDDDFIRPHHSERIHEVYVGDKNIIKFEGDHNSRRPQFYFDSINIFFYNVLQPPEVEKSKFDYPMDEYSVKGNDKHDGYGSLSSDMISFDLSNGDPCRPQLGAAMDDDCDDDGDDVVDDDDEDDQYMEYQLEDFGDFPSNADEEERMMMETMMKSLKDIEVHRHEREVPSETYMDDKEREREPASSTAGSSSADDFAHPMTGSASSSAAAAAPCETSKTLPEPVAATDTSRLCQNTNDLDDMSARTKVTVIVERSNARRSGLDGLLRHWDLMFFRNR